MTIAGKFVTAGTSGISEIVPVPSFEGEENPGRIAFDGTFEIRQVQEGSVSLLTYTFGLHSAPVRNVTVGESLARAYAQSGSRTAQTALEKAGKPFTP